MQILIDQQVAVITHLKCYPNGSKVFAKAVFHRRGLLFWIFEADIFLPKEKGLDIFKPFSSAPICGSSLPFRVLFCDAPRPLDRPDGCNYNIDPTLDAPLAQLAEHRILNPRVEGSTPPRRIFFIQLKIAELYLSANIAGEPPVCQNNTFVPSLK